MDDRLRSFYLESRIKNASPGQLLIMLYDALVRNAEDAENEIAASPGSPERARAPRTLARCLDIVTELSSALRPEVDPALCGNLGNLYHFFAREFSQALQKSEAGPITAILPLLRDLRAAWTQAEKISSRAEAVAA